MPGQSKLHVFYSCPEEIEDGVIKEESADQLLWPGE